MNSPTPLQTILTPTRYPFAVCRVQDGRIRSILALPRTLANARQLAAEINDMNARYHNRAGHAIPCHMVDADGSPATDALSSFWAAA
jgi:hypothetical protein